MTAPLPIGLEVPPFGKIIAVGNGNQLGERYYWLKCEQGGISMMPADVIERKKEVTK